MNHPAMRLLACSAVSMFALATAQAQSSVVAGDSYVQSGTNGAQNFGSLANVLVGPGTGATQNNGLVQFDLSSLSGVPAASVQKAVLWVFVNRVITAGAIDVSDVTTSWDEHTVTFNTQPVPGAILGTIPVTAANQFVGLDLTSEVRTWLSSPSLNHGIQLVAISAPNTAVSLDSKENITTSHPAQLQIVLSGGSGATGPAGPAGATGPTGSTGPAGAAGPTGATGLAGPAGATGPTGATGLAGAAGPTGATGLAGPAGATGATGPVGFTGAAGATGATGPAGSFGTGASATGIPLGIAGHSGANAWNNPTGPAQQAGLNALATVVAPAPCKPSMTIFSYAGTPITWDIFSVTPSSSSTTWTVLSTIISCSTASGAGSTCSATAGSNVAGGTILTLSTSSQTAPGGGGFLAGFSCQ